LFRSVTSGATHPRNRTPDRRHGRAPTASIEGGRGTQVGQGSAAVVLAVVQDDVTDHGVLRAGAFVDLGADDREVGQRDVGGVGELVASGAPDVARTCDRAVLLGNGHVVAVLDEHGVVTGVGDVDPVDGGTTALGDTEDATPATARTHLTDVDVGRVEIGRAHV